MNLANEGLEARKKDEEVATRKRKIEEDKQWEGTSTCSSLSALTYLPSSIFHRHKRTARRQLAFLFQYKEKEED
jgi:hypothetical protein